MSTSKLISITSSNTLTPLWPLVPLTRAFQCRRLTRDLLNRATIWFYTLVPVSWSCFYSSTTCGATHTPGWPIYRTWTFALSGLTFNTRTSFSAVHCTQTHSRSPLITSSTFFCWTLRPFWPSRPRSIDNTIIWCTLKFTKSTTTCITVFCYCTTRWNRFEYWSITIITRTSKFWNTWTTFIKNFSIFTLTSMATIVWAKLFSDG